MIGVGTAMEGINQNEIMYKFALEQSWRSPLNDNELNSMGIILVDATNEVNFDLFRYDLVDITKEVLQYKFASVYIQFMSTYNQSDLYGGHPVDSNILNERLFLEAEPPFYHSSLNDIYLKEKATRKIFPFKYRSD
ncbi:unnamed protein product [Rotaria sp. Silwood1]|nr:unnamed protein product [Rotaria sp. Silwood1]CAF1381522.1 unnamed protein product [Rotaria sp. Silwood1]CAF3542752.1 unnamed protein product [Rotaria sp. Silwood1]